MEKELTQRGIPLPLTIQNLQLLNTDGNESDYRQMMLGSEDADSTLNQTSRPQEVAVSLLSPVAGMGKGGPSNGARLYPSVEDSRQMLNADDKVDELNYQLDDRNQEIAFLKEKLHRMSEERIANSGGDSGGSGPGGANI